MKNTHIEHPEDSILTGDLSVLDWFCADSNISVKIDGAPAIVWGTNPANGKHFVGTKSVFNKKLIKINHDHEEIDQNHQGKVADILHDCLDFLPTTDGIFQGDFSIIFQEFLLFIVPYQTAKLSVGQDVISFSITAGESRSSRQSGLSSLGDS